MAADKAATRAALHAALAQTSAPDRAAWSRRIREHLVTSAWWMSSRTVMLFAPMRSEPDLSPLVNESDSRRRLCFPAMRDDRIVPVAVTALHQLTATSAGVREPSPEHGATVSSETIDLVLVPGLGFTAGGHRIGRGRGHYDRFLASLPPDVVCCGVCFACQVQDVLPREAHDIAMHGVLTENGFSPWHIPAGVP